MSAEPSLTADEALEVEIQQAFDAAYRCLDPHEMRVQFKRMAELVKKRSDEQIARMESERGLR